MITSATLSRIEQHEQLFDQFVYEMFCEPVKPHSNVSKGGLCKRAKFLAKKENLKGPQEKRAEMPVPNAGIQQGAMR